MGNTDYNKEQFDEKYKQECFNRLSKRWNFLDETRIKLANNFDKYLLTFATGSLYLSILFTNSFGNGYVFYNKALLAIGWGLLLVSIIFALLSIYFSVFAYDKLMTMVKEHIDSIYNDKCYCERTNYWNFVLVIFQILSILFFITGIILLSIFYYFNVN